MPSADAAAEAISMKNVKVPAVAAAIITKKVRVLAAAADIIMKKAAAVAAVIMKTLAISAEKKAKAAAVADATNLQSRYPLD